MINMPNNISDEMLAAYLDGNATSDEVALIVDAIKDNPELQEAHQVISDVIMEFDRLDCNDIIDKTDIQR